MESKFIRCSCGKRLPAYKMRSVNNERLCPKCAKVAEAKQKRENKRADDYQVVVILLDGTRLFYQPIGGRV